MTDFKYRIFAKYLYLLPKDKVIHLVQQRLQLQFLLLPNFCRILQNIIVLILVNYLLKIFCKYFIPNKHDKGLEIPLFLWNEILKSWLRSDMALITPLLLNIIQELPCYHKCSNCMCGSLKYISCSLHGLINISRSGWFSASSNSSGT